MDLVDTLRSTGAVRNFRDEPVPPDVLHRVLDTARFAPNGGNQQAWRVIVVEDPERRRALRDLYVDVWQQYVALRTADLRPWAPITDRAAEAEVIRQAVADQGTRPDLGDFAEHFDRIPMMLVVLADLRLLAAMDRDLDRYTMVGGASIYPFVWNLLLAARSEGLGGVITSTIVRREPEAKAILGVPDTHAIAAVLALGHPVHQPTKLTRQPVESFTAIDSFDGPPLVAR